MQTDHQKDVIPIKNWDCEVFCIWFWLIVGFDEYHLKHWLKIEPYSGYDNFSHGTRRARMVLNKRKPKGKVKRDENRNEIGEK